MASLQPGVNKTTKFMSKGTLKNGVTQGGGGGGMAFLIFSHYSKNRPIHLWFVLYLTQSKSMMQWQEGCNVGSIVSLLTLIVHDMVIISIRISLEFHYTNTFHNLGMQNHSSKCHINCRELFESGSHVHIRDQFVIPLTRTFCGN